MALLTVNEKAPVIKGITRMTDILPLTALEQVSCCSDYNWSFQGWHGRKDSVKLSFWENNDRIVVFK